MPFFERHLTHYDTFATRKMSVGSPRGTRRLRAGFRPAETVLLPQSHFQRAAKKRGVAYNHTPLLMVFTDPQPSSMSKMSIYFKNL